jgi:cytochrome c peroxidase
MPNLTLPGTGGSSEGKAGGSKSDSSPGAAIRLPAVDRLLASPQLNAAAAERGDELFSGKAKCNDCHVEPLWTEPGWNLHTPAEIGIDSFQADRSPDGVYKTMNLAGIFVRENGVFMNPANKGRYYHDGRFKTLLDVVNHYNTHFSLGLTAQEKSDVVEYLKSLPSRE